LLLIFLFGAYLLGVSLSSRGLPSVLKEQGAKDHLVSEMLVNLQASSEAEKRAVMAETDEASKTYVEEKSRHVAEASDEKKDRIEEEMTDLDKQASGELEKLSKLSGPARKAQAAQTQAAYEEFQEVHLQMLDFSRCRSPATRRWAAQLHRRGSANEPLDSP
jgi:hypothetical protein